LNPEREDKATLDNFRKEQGEHFFAAQYQQLPVLPGGNMIKLEWFKRYKTPPPLHHCEGYVQSWDPAVTAAETSSYSVCTTWLKAGNLYWLVDVFRMKLDYPDLEKAVAMLYRKYKPILIVIESSHIGWALYAKYRPHLGPVVRTMTPRGSKEERAAKQSAKISAGRVFLPTEAPYLKVYEDEIQQFPKAAYDDQVDSTTQFLGALDYPIPGVTV
jgi:predicted phage terminase large subunit-like protein